MKGALPELFAAGSFFFALVAPWSFRNLDLVYSSTVIMFLEFFLVHAGVFALWVRQRSTQGARHGVAVGLGLFYAVFAVAFGVAAGTGWSAVVITVLIFGRLFAAASSREPLSAYGGRAFFLALLFMVLGAFVFFGPSMRFGVTADVVEAVRAMERARGIRSTFDPARTALFLALWYLAVAVVAWRTALPVSGPLAAAGLRVDAAPLRLEVERLHPNWQRGLFFVLGLLGIGLVMLLLRSAAGEPIAVLILGVAVLGSLPFGFKALTQPRWLRSAVRVHRGRLVLVTNYRPGSTVHVSGRRTATTLDAAGPEVRDEYRDVDEIVPAPAENGRGYDVAIRGKEREARFACGLPHAQAVQLARLMILYYSFGGQPQALRVALNTEPGVCALLEGDDVRRLLSA